MLNLKEILNTQQDILNSEKYINNISNKIINADYE
jgi:hypothetical protein